MLNSVMCRAKFVSWSQTLSARVSTFHPEGKGRTGKFRHAKVAGSVILSGKDGDDAKHYQEKQVRNAIREATK